jgi:membrane associated rhomboid family serine protease
MLQKFIDDIKESTGTALRSTSLMITIAISLLITLAFLCAALFVLVMERHGLIAACLADAAIFFGIALIAGGCYLYQKRQARRRPVEPAKSAFAAAMSDPMLITAGLQIVRTVGVKRLLPLLAIGGIALGLMARKTSGQDQPEE